MYQIRSKRSFLSVISILKSAYLTISTFIIKTMPIKMIFISKIDLKATKAWNIYFHMWHKYIEKPVKHWTSCILNEHFHPPYMFISAYSRRVWQPQYLSCMNSFYFSIQHGFSPSTKHSHTCRFMSNNCSRFEEKRRRERKKVVGITKDMITAADSCGWNDSSSL